MKIFLKTVIILVFLVINNSCDNSPRIVQERLEEIHRVHQNVIKNDEKSAFGGYSITDCQELIGEYKYYLEELQNFMKWREKNYGIVKDNSNHINEIKNRISWLESQIEKESTLIQENNEKRRKKKKIFACKNCGFETNETVYGITGGLCVLCNKYKREDAQRGRPWKE